MKKELAKDKRDAKVETERHHKLIINNRKKPKR